MIGQFVGECSVILKLLVAAVVYGRHKEAKSFQSP